MSAAAALFATVLAISPVTAAPPPTYFLGGTDFTGTGTVTEHDIDWLLNGELTGAMNVPYPRSVTGMDASVAAGADAILRIVDGADGPVRVAAISQGALAIAAAKRALMSRDPADRPARDGLTFVAIGDPSSATGLGGRLPGLHIPIVGVTFEPAPDTPYDTIVVAREYDGLADFPDRPWNLIATMNAVAGILFIHPISYGPDTDLAAIPAADVNETVNSVGGRTTTYLLRNDRLPLLQPLRDLGVDERIVGAIEQPLRQIVDAGYSRNDAPRFAPATAPAAIEQAATDPTPEPAAPTGTVQEARNREPEPTARHRKEDRAQKDEQPDRDTSTADTPENDAKDTAAQQSEQMKPADSGDAAKTDNDNDRSDTGNDQAA